MGRGKWPRLVNQEDILNLETMVLLDMLFCFCCQTIYCQTICCMDPYLKKWTEYKWSLCSRHNHSCHRNHRHYRKPKRISRLSCYDPEKLSVRLCEQISVPQAEEGRSAYLFQPFDFKQFYLPSHKCTYVLDVYNTGCFL